MTSNETSATSPRSTIGILGGLGLLLLGAAALLAAVSSSGLLTKKEAPQTQTPRPDVAPAPPEHAFEIVQLGTFRRDQFLIDKKTGRVWEKICVGKVAGADCDGIDIWDEMYVSEVTPGDSLAARAFSAALAKMSGKK